MQNLTPLPSREHSKSSPSGSSTPFPRTGDATPQEDDSTLVSSSLGSPPLALGGIDDTIKRRKSYGRSQLKPPARGRLSVSEGIQKEHSEKGRVKTSVYRKYIEACSESGFAVFLLTIALSQACSILSNFALRSWSEDNRRTGDNGGITKYLALSGIAQLLSVAFLTIATISLLLLCALRSSKQLHDNVSQPIPLPAPFNRDTNPGFYEDVELVDALPFVILRTNTNGKVGSLFSSGEL